MSKLLRRVSVMLGVVLIAAWYGGRPDSLFAQQGGRLVFVGAGGAYQDALRKAFFEPFQKLHGIHVIEDTGTSPERLQAEVQTGHPTVDIATQGTPIYLALIARNALVPVDYKYFDPTDLKALPAETRLKFGVVSGYGAVIMAFTKSAFPDGKPQPQSWADFWDVKKFPGKRALPYCDAYEGTFPLPEAALLADGVPMDKIYPVDIPRAINKLKELAPNVVWWRNNSQPPEYLVTQEAVMAMSPSGRIQRPIDNGAPLQIVWNQERIDNDKWFVLRGAPNLDNAMRFLAFVSRPQHQAELARIYGFGPSNPRAYEYLSTSAAVKLTTFPDHKKLAYAKDEEWWAANRVKWVETCTNAILR